MRIPASGSVDSAAAIVTISVPMNVNIVMSIADRTAPKPLGMKPPFSYRREMPETSEPGRTPKIASNPMPMKMTIAITLMMANQNSNSP